MDLFERTRFVLFDGAMGTMLQACGLLPGELPELFNLSAPDRITAIHRAYVEAGSDVVTTNTFQANRQKLPQDASVSAVIEAGVACAKAANPRYVALDVGPLGPLLAPAGTMSFDDAYERFREQMVAGEAAGADLILIETMSDLYEAKAAVLAAKENTRLPVVCTMTFQEGGRTFLGTDATAAAVTLSALGVDALGANCSMGPDELLPVVRDLLKYSRVPVLVQANAGLPELRSGHAHYTISPEVYAQTAVRMALEGVTLLGGCCGTNPDYIRAVKAALANAQPAQPPRPGAPMIASCTHALDLSRHTTVIGERINPTGKKKLQAALRAGDFDELVREAIAQQDAGADALDVNCGLPELDEPKVLAEAVRRIQAVSTLPLVIDSANPSALEAAARAVNGVPIINSVSGKRAVMDAIFPIAKKYGALVIGLTLDDEGIPETWQGRLAIAKTMADEAERHGLPRENLIVDCLTLTASAQQAQVMETVRAISRVRHELSLLTVLGVSNVSFGLPGRDALNRAFLLAALGAGLNAAILNPLSASYQEAVRAYRVLSGEDAGAAAYVAAAQDAPKDAAAPQAALALGQVVRQGMPGEAVAAALRLLQTQSPLEVINAHLVPALSEAGERFERGELFLPQLMQCAQAAQQAFEVIERRMLMQGMAREPLGRILIATVQGDIHDIGKNIVRMLLQANGYEVIDLGKDVPIGQVVRAAKQQNIRLVGLSALMTTTVQAMKDTIFALREADIPCSVFVGGAVLTEDYAAYVGADHYARDAVASVRIANAFFENKGSF